MDAKMTMEITNDKLEEVIKEYVRERTQDKLIELLNLLRPTKLLVPAMLQAPNRPIPCFLKNHEGQQFLVVYTSKGQIPAEPKSQAILSMPFPACNEVVVKPEFSLNGMVINPFSDNLVLKAELIQKLREADKKAAEAKQVKMTPEQFRAFVKKQVEFGVIPKRLFAEGAAFVEKLCEEKEEFVNQIFAEGFKEPQIYPYSVADYSVMALDIAEDMTLIRVDLPEDGLIPPLCSRFYITLHPITKKVHYYTIEATKDKGVKLLGEMDEHGKHIAHGPAPVEGAQLQKIIDLTRYSGSSGLTS